MNKPTIGFIGLGLMGSNIAECLQNNGFDLVVMGRNKEAVAKSVARGAVEVTTPKALDGRAILSCCASPRLR